MRTDFLNHCALTVEVIFYGTLNQKIVNNCIYFDVYNNESFTKMLYICFLFNYHNYEL